MSDTVVGQPDAPERPRGRPRSAIADTAIREAAVELFAERGFEGVSIEDVAALAGVSRATIYRRYPSKVDLIVEAAGCLATNEIAFPDTGNLAMTCAAWLTLSSTGSGTARPAASCRS